MSAAIHVHAVKDAHSYTRSRVPWRLEDDPKSPEAEKLYHYLSGGGSRSFGRSVKQEEADHKRNCFLIGASIFALVWLVLLVV